MTTQNEALRLATYLDGIFISEEISSVKAREIAAELRRLQAENEILSNVASEYGAWIQHQAGGGDYESFLRSIGIIDAAITKSKGGV